MTAPAEMLCALRALRAAHRRIVFLAFLEDHADPAESQPASDRRSRGEPRGRWTSDPVADARTSACVALFESGVDDVLSAGIAPAEYAARLRALIRRRGWTELEQETQRLEPGQRPRLDPQRRRLLGSLGSVLLTAKECIIMQVLLESDGLSTRAVISERLWTDGWYGTRKAIDMHVVNLRRKLRSACGDEWSIETVRGEGFVLVPGEALAPSTLSG